MTTLAATVGPNGISAPDFADILQQLKNAYWSIYGSDAVLDPNTQDGQLLSVFAQAIYDSNQAAIAVYNAFSPATAQGTALSSSVKLNGIRRLSPTASTAVVTIVGQAQTIINGGVVGDNAGLGTRWDLPPTVTIPGSGTINVTAMCETLGAVAAGIGTLTQILTPTNGWQTVTNAAAATLGAPTETDAALRERQASSTALSAQTPLSAIAAAVANVPGVQRSQPYENDTDTTNGLGIPGHSISMVVQGGDPVAIATAIELKKSPGTGTFGTTSEIIIDPAGVPDTINFFVLTLVVITVNVTVKQLPGYVTTTTTLIQQAIASFLSGLPIGTLSYLNRLLAPANLSGDAAIAASVLLDPAGIGLTQPQLDALSATFNITAITQSRPSDAPPAVQDVPIAFNEACTCTIANVNVTLT